jgi:hypothetical protein
MSTITSRSRYLSMICAALANAAQFTAFPPGPAGIGARREAVEPFERLWALACAAARQRNRRSAADDLRGIAYAERYLHQLEERGEPAGPNFRMLKSQTRTGGVPTYWAMLQTGDLVTEEGTLTPDGEALAKEFPLPPLTERDLKKLGTARTASRVRLTLKGLYEWADKCHLGASGAQERRMLASALRAPDRRDAISRALVEHERRDRSLPEEWEVAAMRRLRSLLAADSAASVLGAPIVIDAIIVFEQFHEAALAVFNALLWWGTEHSNRSTAKLCSEIEFRKASELARQRAAVLVEFASACGEGPVRKAIEDFMIFATELARGRSKDVLDEVLRRHHKVQSGKLDGGAPKRDWITYEYGGRVLRPSPRYQQRERPALARGRVLTHPYRVEQFIRMLRESKVLADRTVSAKYNA